MKTYFRILSYAKPYRRFLPQYFTFSILSIVFGVINFTLLIPLLNLIFEVVHVEKVLVKPDFTFSIHYLIDLFYYHFSEVLAVYGKSGALQFVCVIIMISIFFSTLFRYLGQRVITKMRVTLLQNIRNDLYGKLTRSDLGFFFNYRKGDLLSRFSSDFTEVEICVVNTVEAIFRDPLQLIFFMIPLFSMSVKLTLFSLIVLPLSGAMIAGISKRLKKDVVKSQDVLGRVLSIVEETISGVRIIKAFNAQDFVVKRFQRENHTYSKVLRSALNKRELSSPLSEFLGVSVVVGIILYGGSMVLSSSPELSASEFITYVILYSRVLGPAKSISNAVSAIQKGIVSGERVFRIIDSKERVIEAERAHPISEFKQSIVFKNVSFAYHNFDDNQVLKNIDLTIQKGKQVALVGQSGSGKSTLADLISRFYDPSLGDILIDGQSIRNLKIKDLRDLMGIVTQESILFNETVFNNIAFGMENVSEKDVIEASKIANAHEFIIRMPEGYQSNIGDRGGKLSGGQKQRLSIARAILKNPPILILDEATSALDTESEKLVQEALSNLMKNRTSLIIAHRLSTIQHADEIVVLEKGVITERGSHNDLISNNGTYKKLYDLQLFV